MKCQSCKREIKEGIKFCPYCGSDVFQYRPNKRNKGIPKALIVLLSLICVVVIGFGTLKVLEHFQSKVTNVKLEIVTEEVSGGWTEQHGVITAYNDNGTEAWKIETEPSEATELSAANEIGIHKDRYYYEANGIIYAVKLSNGKEIWSKDFDASISASDFDENDNLYCCGYYGPYLLVFDKDGNLLNKIDDFGSDGYILPYEIKYLNDHLEIKMEADAEGTRQGTVRVSLPDYDYTLE